MQQFSSIPIQPAWTAIDLVPFDSKLFAGRPSTVGDRAGGLIQRAADLHIVFGSSLSLRQVGFNSKDQFKGKIVQIDVDPNYCFKPFPRVETHITIDPTLALEFIVQSLERREEPGAFKGWLNRCRKTVLDYRQEVTWFQEIDDGLNPYRFLRHLSEQAPQDSLFVCANATAAVVFFQVANLKKNQRTFSNAGSASMGYDLPASIGAAYSTDRPVICLAGDGSIQMNIQELATISGNNLDIRILLLDNQGYLSIRASQINHFKETFYESTSNGLFFPKWKEIAEAYSLPYFEVNRNNLNLDHLNSRGPHLTHVSLSPSFTFTPKASSRLDSNGRIASSPIYDLEPFIEETLLQGILADLISETEVIP
jgi:acetolactate synthase-1/2/3 large subunit